MMTIRLHDKSTIHTIDWSAKIDGQYAKDYIVPMMEHGATAFIANAHTNVYALELEHIVLPITVNDAEYENSYVCSPYTHYVSYAKEELWELNNPLLEKLLLIPINLLGYWFKRSDMNQVVIVNNWLLSTNLYHHMTYRDIQQITDLLQSTFPHHAILFRSLNARLYPDTIKHLYAAKYTALFARSIYIFDPQAVRSMNRKSRKDLDNDKRLLKRSGYDVLTNDDLTEADMKTVRDLYNELYIEKYSRYNPAFTPAYYEHVRQHHLLQFRVLQKNGNIDGVMGYFIRDGVLTTPILGYNTSLPSKEGLYRLLSCLIAEEVLQHDYIGHFSAGAGQFKRNRGAKQEMEYSCIYIHHLPKHRQFMWKALQCVLKYVLEPMARKAKF